MKSAADLDRDILAMIAAGLCQADDTRFNAVALDLFAYQFAHNTPYRNFCRRRGLEPGGLSSWRDTPAVPTPAFKTAPLACFPIETAAAVFETSGTTGGHDQPGRHYLETTELYRASLLSNFKTHLLPDTLSLPMLMVSPSPGESPRSSLVFMLDEVARAFSRTGPRYFIKDGRLEAVSLCDALRLAESFREPVLIAGTALAFVNFFEFCRLHGQYFHLPPDSRVMETGGFKGRSRNIDRADLIEMFRDFLGLDHWRIVNEYGMTELGVQFYDAELSRRLSPAAPARFEPARGKTIPSWCRVLIIDPATGLELPAGQRGLVRVFDLTNRGSVMAVQTEDIGALEAGGLEVTGRAAGADVRGCSLAADDLLD